ncbi:MAG: CoA transferase, partial [Betaproteobacteria bacterium]
MSGPLAGVRVIEVGHMLMGPYCGMLLADLGAEVVKVEPGPAGDIGRSISPHAIGSHNAYFASLNRNKKSVVLDLASESGREAFGELVSTARALVTNLRPSAIKKLRLTYDGVKDWNPKIVCVALTGYGLESP